MQEFGGTDRLNDDQKKLRAIDLEKLTGVWHGESAIESCTIPTVWGDTELTFTRDQLGCRLKGQGTSKWNGQDVEFCLVGSVDPATMKFELYKTHIGKFNNTIVFRGRIEVTPPRLFGRSLKGSVKLERVRGLNTTSSTTGPTDLSLRDPGSVPRISLLSPPTTPTPSSTETDARHRQPRDTQQMEFSRETTDDSEQQEDVYTQYHTQSTLSTTPQPQQRRQQHLKQPLPQQQQQKQQAQARKPRKTDEHQPVESLGYSVALSAEMFPPAEDAPLGEEFPTAPPSDPKQKSLRQTTGDTGNGNELIEGYPSRPPESPHGPMMSPTSASPTTSPRLFVEHSREYEPCLRPSGILTKTGDGEEDAAALCGIWMGSSTKKTQSHPNGEVTAWNDVVLYFNLKRGNSGTVKGRGESVWRSHVIPFLLEGAFDLDRGTLQLRKLHVGKFNNILNYDLILGSSENLLVILNAANDDGSHLELKQVQQVHDSPEPYSAKPQASPKTPILQGPQSPPTAPMQIPKPSMYGQTNFARSSPPSSPAITAVSHSPTGSLYSFLPSSAISPPKGSASSSAESSSYSILPGAAMEDDLPSAVVDRLNRESRISKYSVYLSGMMSSDRLSAQQQKALSTYRSTQGITEEEHQAALRAINMSPKDFERKLQRTPSIDKSDDMCKVCFERPIDCVILPCGHLACCATCAIPQKKCPMCRGGITELKKVYRA